MCRPCVGTCVLTCVGARVYFLAASTKKAQKTDTPATMSTGQGRPGSLTPCPTTGNPALGKVAGNQAGEE